MLNKKDNRRIRDGDGRESQSTTGHREIKTIFSKKSPNRQIALIIRKPESGKEDVKKSG